jgi:hypothetical protein
MANVSELLNIEIPGYGWTGWGIHLDELLPWLPERDVLRREEHPDHPEFAFDRCAKRSVIVCTAGRVCGSDAVARMNFCDGRLCAVHYFFPQTAALGDKDYCAILECLRHRLASSLGRSGMRTKVGGHGDVSFRWSQAGLHAEIRGFRDQDRVIQLAANDPGVCDWCFAAQ